MDVEAYSTMVAILLRQAISLRVSIFMMYKPLLISISENCSSQLVSGDSNTQNFYENSNTYKLYCECTNVLSEPCQSVQEFSQNHDS